MIVRYGGDVPTPVLDDMLTDLGLTVPLDDREIERVMVAAIHARRLRPVLTELVATGHDVGDHLRECDELISLTAATADRVVDRLGDGGVTSSSMPPTADDELLRLSRIRVADGHVAARAVELLERDGRMRRNGPTNPSAWKSFIRTSTSVVLNPLDDDPTTVELVWGSGAPRKTRLQRLVSPIQADFDVVDLPEWLWPLYHLVRPVRLLGRRLGWERFTRLGDDLGHYLATPAGLTSAFVDVASPGVDDLVVDIGCGDGRLLVDAAGRYGCRGRGIERDASLAALAADNVAAAGLSDRIEIVHGDGLDVSLADATVVLLFLPVEVVAAIIGPLLDRLTPGTAVFAHEQMKNSSDPPPLRSVPLVSSSGVTVVSHWTAPAPK